MEFMPRFEGIGRLGVALLFRPPASCRFGGAGAWQLLLDGNERNRTVVGDSLLESCSWDLQFRMCRGRRVGGASLLVGWMMHQGPVQTEMQPGRRLFQETASTSTAPAQHQQV
ncbi:hypothetical protein PMIN05_012353 [Paraphaeosphaeria minitans]